MLLNSGAAAAIFLTGVFWVPCQGAATTNAVFWGPCQGAATTNFLAGVFWVQCWGAATANFLAGVFWIRARAQLLPIFCKAFLAS